MPNATTKAINTYITCGRIRSKNIWSKKNSGKPNEHVIIVFKSIISFDSEKLPSIKSISDIVPSNVERIIIGKRLNVNNNELNSRLTEGSFIVY